MKPLDFAATIRDDPFDDSSNLWPPTESAPETRALDQDTGWSIAAVKPLQCRLCPFEFGLLAPLPDEKVEIIAASPCLNDRVAIPLAGREARIHADDDRRDRKRAAREEAEVVWLEPKLSLLRDILLVKHLEAWKRGLLQALQILFAECIRTQQFALLSCPGLCFADAIGLRLWCDKR